MVLKRCAAIASAVAAPTGELNALFGVADIGGTIAGVTTAGQTEPGYVNTGAIGGYVQIDAPSP